MSMDAEMLAAFELAKDEAGIAEPAAFSTERYLEGDGDHGWKIKITFKDAGSNVLAEVLVNEAGEVV